MPPTESLPSSSFRLYLQAELARRCAANNQYSLRAFASALGVDHSTLSQLIRGRRQLTARTIQRIASQLSLDRATIDAFVAHEQQATANPESSQALRQLTMDTIGVISDPTHRAILELTHLPEFVADSRWIAQLLNLSVDEVNRCLTRLIHVGLLEMVGPTTWLDHADVTDSPPSNFQKLAVNRLVERVRQASHLIGARETLSIPPEYWERATRLLEQLRALSDASMPGHELDIQLRSLPD